MARVVLGVTGSVAAVRTPGLWLALVEAGHEVRVVATDPSLAFFDPSKVGDSVWTDADEWPAADYQRGDPVLHIEFRAWADLLVVAPLDANTLAKVALGLSDNFLTCILRAWDFARPVVLAPAMNTLMWESPVTRRHFVQLLEDRGDGLPQGPWGLDDLPDVFRRHAPRIAVVAPVSKALACGDVGVGGMAEVDAIVRAVGDAQRLIR